MTSLEQAISVEDVVLFEDDPARLKDLTDQFHAKGMTAHIAKSVDEVLDFQTAGAKCFVLDGKYRDDLKAGAKAARSLKLHDPSCFIAILTRYPESFQDPEIPVELLLRKESQSLGSAVDKICERMRETELDRDMNHQAFLRYMKDEEWVSRNDGLYVGFIEGKMVSSNMNAVALIEDLDRLLPTDDMAKYYNRVQKIPKARRVFTPLRKFIP